MKNVLNKKLNLVIITCLSLLVLFGFYKNGVFLYQKKLISFVEMFRPILIVCMSISGCVLGSFLHERKKNKAIKLEFLEKLKSNIIEAILIACVLPLSTSPLLLFLLILCFYFIFDKTNFNHITLMIIITGIINVLLGINTFENVYESTFDLHYNSLDLFLGMGVGGISSTSIFIILISLFILTFNKIYKKNVAIASIMTFTILTLLIAIITNNYTHIFKTLFSHNILFSLVFISTDIKSSCYTDKGQKLFGIIISILTVVLSYIIPDFAVFVAILFTSLIKNVLDRIFVII